MRASLLRCFAITLLSVFANSAASAASLLYAVQRAGQLYTLDELTGALRGAVAAGRLDGTRLREVAREYATHAIQERVTSATTT